MNVEANHFDMWLLGPTILIAAILLSTVLIALLRPLLLRHALVQPNPRSSHRVATPQGGGAAVIAATIAVTVFAAFAQPADFAPSPTLWTVLSAAGFIALVGIVDDIWTIPVAPRLLLQSLAVAAVIVALPEESRLFTFLPWPLERVLLFMGGLWFVNLVNFMDGLDWMTVATVVPATAALAILGILGALPPAGTLMALSLLGAMIGFAPFNRPVARLFLGDAGSLPVGLILGWLLILLASGGFLIAALLLPLYYLADTGVTLFRRIAAREPLWVAHRSHYYQRATTAGMSTRQVVRRVALVNTVLALLALLSALHPSPLLAGTTFAGGIVLVIWLMWRFVNGEEKCTSS